MEDGDRAAEYSKEKEDSANGLLWLCISRPCRVHCDRRNKTVQENWLALKSVYADNGLVSRVMLLRRFTTTSMVECGSAEKFVNTMTDTVARLREIDFPIEDEWVAHFILAGLPEEYDPMIMALQNTGQVLSLEDIKLQLLQEKKPSRHEADNNALLAENIALKAEKEKNEIVCFSCGDKGHYPDECKRSNNKGRGFKKSNQHIRCWSCNQTGHFADNCRNNGREDRNNGRDDRNNCRDDRHYGRAAWIDALKSSDGGMRTTDWIVDSGASVYMTNQEHAGIKLKDNISDIVVASGSP